MAWNVLTLELKATERSEVGKLILLSRLKESSTTRL